MCRERSCVLVPRADVAGNTRQERIEIEWFEETLRERIRGELRHRRCVCGHEHHRYVCQIVAVQLRHDIETGQTRKMEIEQYERRPGGVDRQQCTFAVVGRATGIPLVMQRFNQEFDGGRIVVDN